MLSQKSRYLPYLMWLFPVFFFAYQFILRLWPGLMMHSIMAQFSINASDFGLLAAFYYYGYAGMQIPVAILLERFGARSIVFAFAMICGLATMLFTYTDNFYLALFSRFLVGAGSAVGFLGVSKIVSEWFPKEQYARMIGFSFSIGLMGAIYGGKPINLLIEKHSWQNVAYVLALVSLLIGIGAFIVLSIAKPSNKESQTPQLKFSNFKSLLSTKVIWLLALSNLLMVGSLEGFADVWGVPYLMSAYNLNKGEAAGLVSFVFMGMLFGGPLLAYCSKKRGNYPVIMACGIGMASVFGLMLLNQSFSVWLLSLLLFCIGLMCCYQVIVFAAGSQLVAPQLLGITVAFLNCINMLGGSFFHTSIGKIMDLFWTGALNDESLRQYDLEVYQNALTIIPICAIIGTALVFWLSSRLRLESKNM